MIRIDGSFGEGGGQILRTSVALAQVLGEEVEVYNIRANRPKPGLSNQHLTVLKAFSKIFDAEVEGAQLGSTKIVFKPGRKPAGEEFKIDIGTAGSVTLLLQALLPAVVFYDLRLTLKGGTDVRWSPPIDYFSEVFLRNVRNFGVDAEVELVRRGYYPRGGGIVRVVTHSSELSSANLENRGDMIGIRGVAHSCNLPHHITEREARASEEALKPYKVDIRLDRARCPSTGTGIVLWAEFEVTSLGASSLGEKGKPAEVVGREAALHLKEEIDSGAGVDVHMSDQLIPYMAITQGGSFTVREVSSHLTTNIWVAEKFVDVKFEVERRDGFYRVRVK